MPPPAYAYPPPDIDYAGAPPPDGDYGNAPPDGDYGDAPPDDDYANAPPDGDYGDAPPDRDYGDRPSPGRLRIEGEARISGKCLFLAGASLDFRWTNGHPGARRSERLSLMKLGQLGDVAGDAPPL